MSHAVGGGAGWIVYEYSGMAGQTKKIRVQKKINWNMDKGIPNWDQEVFLVMINL